MSETTFRERPTPYPFEIPGLIRISHLAATTEGFTIRTRHTLRMKEGLPTNERRPAELMKGNPIRQKATEEMRDEVQRAKEKAGIIEGKEITPLQRQEYIDILLTTRKTGLRSARKVGLENITVDGNTITVDVKAPYYKMYAAVPATASSEARELAHPAAVAMVIQTVDDKLILQYRTPYDSEKKSGNRFYGGILGVSAGGYFDAPRNGHGTGRPGEVDNTEVVKMASREAHEEIGIEPTHLTHVAIVGIAQDLLKPHDELLLSAKTNLTFKEIQKLHIAEETAKSDIDFAENYYPIPATSTAIETLLTKVHVPLPPTHIAAYFAVGNRLALEEGGLKMAIEWQNRVRKGVQDNYNAMNTAVSDYWLQTLQEIEQLPESEREEKRSVFLAKFGTINMKMYDPQLSAEDQGLPPAKSELERTHLLAA